MLLFQFQFLFQLSLGQDRMLHLGSAKTPLGTFSSTCWLLIPAACICLNKLFFEALSLQQGLKLIFMFMIVVIVVFCLCFAEIMVSLAVWYFIATKRVVVGSSSSLGCWTWGHHTMGPAVMPTCAFGFLSWSSFLFWPVQVFGLFYFCNFFSLKFLITAIEANNQNKPRAEWDLMIWESATALQNDIFYKRFQHASWMYLMCVLYFFPGIHSQSIGSEFLSAIHRPVLESSRLLKSWRQIWRSCRTLAGQRSILWSSFQTLVWHVM